MQYTNQAASFLTEINSNKNHVIKIVEQPKSYNTRSRRGLINMVGRVANVLFGVCDDTDAKYFHDKIKELERSKSQLFQITETQTQIMKSMLTNVNSSLIELEKKQGSLVDGYNHLLHKTDVIEMDVGILKFQNALTERIALLNVILTQYAYETENLVSIVNSALLGHIHPSLLDASEFNQQLKQIKIQLPIGLGLPIDLAEKGISELLQIVEISVVYVKGILMFIMEIPLIDNYDFMLYKSIPLPVKVRNNLYAIIELNSDYIAIDKSLLYNIEISNYQLSKCKTTTNTIICNHEQPIQHVRDSCETMLFRNPKTLPNVCTIKYIKFSHNVWHKLENKNSWLYVTSKENIIITCKNVTAPLIINVNGTGIFSLENHCEAYTADNEIKLVPKRKISTNIYKNYTPKLNLSINFDILKNVSNKDLDNTLFPKENLRIKDNLNKLTENSKSLDELQSHFKRNVVNTIYDSNHYLLIGVIVMVGSVGLLLVLVLLFLMYKNYQNKEIVSKTNEDLEVTHSPESPLPRLI